MPVNYKRKKTLLEKLELMYPDAGSELIFKNEYQLAVAVILSAQCTDKKVNETTPALFRRYPSFKKLADGSVEDIEPIIRPVNYYKTKAKNLLAMALMVLKDFGGKLPRSRSELLKLPGVGPKTANVLLSERDIEPALAVDTHVFRVAKRLGLADGTTPAKVEEQLKNEFPPEDWRKIHHSFILHGRRVCIARKPRCPECELRDLCDYYKGFRVN
jgi:endonuclease-3